jgi:pimeloyl-ACP methyl ester carboxylesterase
MPLFVHDGVELSYIDQGTGAPMILQHGLGGDGRQPVMLYRSARRLVCLECRGHGHSPLGPPDRLSFATFSADLLALLDSLGLDRVVLGGISMGAGVALRLAAEHPQRVCALILIRPAWADRAWPAHLTVYRLIAELLASHEPVHARRLFARSDAFLSICNQSPAAARSLLGQFDRPAAVEHRMVLTALPGDVPLGDGLLLQDIAVPTLVIATPCDPIHPLGLAKRLASALPHAHMMEAAPKDADIERHSLDVTKAIDEFLSRLELL